MKFIFADSLDYVDPRYDFIADRSPPDREPYWHDLFLHEALSGAPYDGILVSRGIADRRMASAKYTEAQARRFRIVGAREFLRYRLVLLSSESRSVSSVRISFLSRFTSAWGLRDGSATK